MCLFLVINVKTWFSARPGSTRDQSRLAGRHQPSIIIVIVSNMTVRDFSNYIVNTTQTFGKKEKRPIFLLQIVYLLIIKYPLSLFVSLKAIWSMKTFVEVTENWSKRHKNNKSYKHSTLKCEGEEGLNIPDLFKKGAGAWCCVWWLLVASRHKSITTEPGQWPPT